MRGDYVTSHFEALWRRQASTVHGHGVCKLCLCRAGRRLQRAQMIVAHGLLRQRCNAWSIVRSGTISRVL